MTWNPHRKADPLEHEIEIGLKPGAFISYSECLSFTSILEKIAARIAEAAKTDAVRAVALWSGPMNRPTFLERAKARWEKRIQEGG